MTINILKHTDEIIKIEILNLFNNCKIELINQIEQKLMSIGNVCEFSSTKIIIEFTYLNILYNEIVKSINENKLKEFIKTNILNLNETTLYKLIHGNKQTDKTENILKGNGFYYFRYGDKKEYAYIDSETFLDFFNKTFVDIYLLLNTNNIYSFLEYDNNIYMYSLKNYFDENWTDLVCLSVPEKEKMKKLTVKELTEMVKNYKNKEVGFFSEDQKVFDTQTPEIDMFDVITGGKIVYVILPALRKSEASLN